LPKENKKAINPDSEFQGKVILITGAAGILGSVFAESFARLGGSLVLIDLEENNLLQLKNKISSLYKVDVITFSCDITKEDDVKLTHKYTIDKFGKIDILINNAATKTENITEFFTKFEDYSSDTWEKVMSVNVNGAFLMAKTIGKHMVECGQGVIIQIASIYGLQGVDKKIYEGSSYMGFEINTPAVYATSKAALIGLTKYLAAYWGDQGIRVNCIAPGGVESGQNKIFNQRYSEKVPMNRMANASEISDGVLFLAGQKSSYINGHTLVVDGGLTIW
jgi:NAD(P)-dependent dehydrogenase (short-subunit alcohol dehydrogenase family)